MLPSPAVDGPVPGFVGKGIEKGWHVEAAQDDQDDGSKELVELGKGEMTSVIVIEGFTDEEGLVMDPNAAGSNANCEIQ